MDLNHLDITVDNLTITARPGQNILEACLSAQKDIPYFCWHPALGSVGSCRQCAVKVFNGPDDHTGQIVMACMTPVTPGLRMSIDDPAATAFRDKVIEFVLTNHPHDCPVCEVGGECHLQDMTVLAKHTDRRYRFTKRTHLNQNLGPFIRHEMNRCIGCYRCVRFYRDYAGGTDFGVFGANRNVYFGRAEPGTLENEFSGNLVEVCPTGVFVDKPFSARFRRKWDMRATPSICPHCAVGCNITVQEREGEFRRVTNRYNATLNGYFLCDRGRFGTDFLESAARLRVSKRRTGETRRDDIDADTARNALTELLRTTDAIGIGSPRASLEANYALRALVGAERFFAGVSDHDSAIAATAAAIMRDHHIPIATIADLDAADTALILGDDPSDIAPILALALRQMAQRADRATLDQRQIPDWNDTPSRIAADGHRVPLLIATPLATRLDRLAHEITRLAPAALTALACAIARRLDGAAPLTTTPEHSENPSARASDIAAVLGRASAPVIVVGGDACGPDLLLAAANIVIALRRAGAAARLSILLPEANALGFALLDAKPLSAALDHLAAGHTKRVIVLENDLHRRSDEASLDHAFAHVETLCVLDHIETATTENADIAIAIGSFAESDITYVNLEGRMQRGHKAIFSNTTAPQSWHVLRDAGIAAGRLPADRWPNHAALIGAMAAELPVLAAGETLWPDIRSGAMQRQATLPHRYSGRTAVNAGTDVREPKPHAHPDSPLGTTMEGPPLHAGSSIVPYFWSPGWNSAQAVNKFQDEIGGELTAGGSGVLMFGGSAGRSAYATLSAPPRAAATKLFIPLARVFGSDELSALAPAVTARMAPPDLVLGPDDAAQFGVTAGSVVDCTIGATTVTRLVTIDPDQPAGTIGIATGFPGESSLHLPGPGSIKASTGDAA